MPSATYEVHEEISLGYEFGNKETRLQLELLDDLQKLGVSKYLDLPQSTGKSSVLQAVTEMPFPIDDRMCTRFATEIVLQKTSDETTSIVFTIVPAVDEKLDRVKALLSWRPSGFDQDTPLNKSTMQSMLSQAEEMIFSDSGSPGKYNTIRGRRNRLSGSTLRITRTGPHEPNLKIIDVPGLVRGNESNDEHRTAKALVRKYLDNSRSIIVVVIDVVDLERQEIFQMLDGLPDQESRVIGVVNKCDTKQKKSHDWVFDLIRNDPAKSQKYLKEGWFGLRNRQACETGISDHERDKLEGTFFESDEWNSLDPAKLGRHKLKGALVRMLNRHIKKSIPGLLSDIQKKVDICNNRIIALGEPRTTNPAQFMLVNRIAMQYSQKVRSGLKGHYNDLSDSQTFIRSRVLNDLDTFQVDMAQNGLCHAFQTSEADGESLAVGLQGDQTNLAPNILKSSTYKWIHTAIQSYRSSSDYRRNPEVEIKLWQEQTLSWNQIAAQALRNVEETVNTINESLFQEVCPEHSLRLKLTNWLNEDFARASDQAREELQRLLADERGAQLFSLQPLKCRKEQEYRAKRIQAVAEKLAQLDPSTAKPIMAQPQLDVTMVDSKLVIASLIHGNPEVVGVLETHDSLAAYYDIALYRFIDNFALQVIERHLLGPNGPLRLFNSEYVSQKLYGPGNAEVLNGLAGEDPVVAQERADLMIEKASLEESRRKVMGFRISAA